MPTFTVNIPGGRVGNFLAGAVVASVIGGTAVAITSPDFTYSTTKTGYYSIHPMDLTPNQDGALYVNFYSFAELRAADVAGYSTGINLPQGSRITQLAVWTQVRQLARQKFSCSAPTWGTDPQAHSLRHKTSPMIQTRGSLPSSPSLAAPAS